MNSSPIVDAFDQVIFVNAFTAASNLFTYSDSEGDPAVQFRFTDGSGLSTSGFFELNGSPAQNGGQFTIDASDLANLIYVGGSNISNEMITIEAYDGTSWSNAATLQAYTAVENLTRPEVMVTPTTVLANERIAATTFISAMDPDGHPIEKFFLRDRRVNNAYFNFQGTDMPQATYFTVQAEELAELYLHGSFAGADLIDVFAWDGADWSVVATGGVQVLPNANRPVAQFNRAIVPQELETQIADMTAFVDADGNTAKAYRFYHTNPHAHGGNIVVAGVDQPNREWIRVNADQLGTVAYKGSSRTYVEKVRYQVYDGRFWSPVETLEFDNIPVPELGGPDNAIDRHLQTIDVQPMFTKIDDGPEHISYQVVDTNGSPISGNLESFGGVLSANTIHTMSSNAFDQLQFRTGPYEDRSYDEVLVRAWNGTFYSDWERAVYRGEPEYDQALFSGLDWNQHIESSTPDGKLIITYSFMQQFPDYETGEAEDNPGNDPPRPFSVFTPQQRAASRRAFRHLESFANVQFVEVADTVTDPVGGDRGGTIRMGNYRVEFDASTAAAFAFLPSADPQGGDIWINDFYTSTTNWSEGSYGYFTFIHELGHAMGMLHPFTAPGSGEVKPVLPLSTDNTRHSVMSYTNLDESPMTFQLYDMSELQRLYGANTEYNTGDDVYSVDTFFSGRANGFGTIWDGGGTDTLSAEGSSASDVVVDLRSGSFSTIGDGSFTENLGIAFATEIENALGSANNDTITGNNLDNSLRAFAGNDSLRGMGGDDYMSGGAGNDTYVFGLADGNDVINEEAGAGRDKLVIDTSVPGMNDITDDLSFRLNNNDLIIDLTYNDGLSRNRLVIENQRFGRYRIETLEIGARSYDLVDLTAQATSFEQKFMSTGISSSFGELVSPT